MNYTINVLVAWKKNINKNISKPKTCGDEARFRGMTQKIGKNPGLFLDITLIICQSTKTQVRKLPSFGSIQSTRKKQIAEQLKPLYEDETRFSLKVVKFLRLHFRLRHHQKHHGIVPACWVRDTRIKTIKIVFPVSEPKQKHIHRMIRDNHEKIMN